MAQTPECDWRYRTVDPDSPEYRIDVGDGHAMETAAAWIPLLPGVKRGVMIVFRSDFYFDPRTGGIGLYEFTLPAGMNFAPWPRVWSLPAGMNYAPGSGSLAHRSSHVAECCGLHGGVLAELADGSTVVLPAHKRQSVKLGLPALKPTYPAVPLSEATGEGVIAAGDYRLVPLTASGVLCYAGEPPKILWNDATGRPRGFEVYEPGALRTPRFAVAGQRLMFAGRSPKGFASAPILAEAGATVANFAYHAAIAKF